MKIIDARSGKVIKVGETVTYPGDSNAGYTLFAVRENVLTAEATIKYWAKQTPEVVQLQVRFTHPSHLFQKVAFVPS